jgi:hypothetical protein
MNDHPDGSPTIDVECNPNILESYPNVHHISNISFPAPPPQTYNRLPVVPPWCREAMNWRGWNEVDQVLDGVKFSGLYDITPFWHIRDDSYD